MSDFFRQQPRARQRRKQDRDGPGAEQGNEHHRKQGKAVFTGAGGRKTNGNKAGNHHQSTGEHREGRRFERMGGRMPTGIPRFQPRDHRFDGDHGVIHQQAQGNDQRPERNTLKADAGEHHAGKRHGEHQRDGRRHDQSGP